MPGRRLIDPSIWNDARPILKELGDTGKNVAIVFLYLLTGPHSNPLGLFRVPPEYIAVDLGCPTDVASQSLVVLGGRGLAVYDAGAQVVWVPHTLRGQPLQNEKQVLGALAALAGLPDTPLLAALYDAVVPQRFARPYLKPLLERLEQRLGLTAQDTSPVSITSPVLTGPSAEALPKPFAPNGQGEGYKQAQEMIERLKDKMAMPERVR